MYKLKKIMNRIKLLGFSFLLSLCGINVSAQQEMDEMWGRQQAKVSTSDNGRGHLFEWGNYAMFIHWGLYSHLGNVWNGKTCYGIGEWMIDPQWQMLTEMNIRQLPDLLIQWNSMQRKLPMPVVVYGAGPSPWKHVLPWGDVVRQKDKLYLVVYEWPGNGELFLPGLQSQIQSAYLLSGDKKERLKFKNDERRVSFEIPCEKPDKLMPVIELDIKGDVVVDTTQVIDPEFGLTDLSVKFA